MDKIQVEQLVEKVGIREVVRVNNVIAKENDFLEDIVYFAKEFDSFCGNATPTQIATFISGGWDMEVGYAFSFSDCIIFSVNWMGDLELATTKDGVIKLLFQTLTGTDCNKFLKLINKDYIDKF